MDNITKKIIKKHIPHQAGTYSVIYHRVLVPTNIDLTPKTDPDFNLEDKEKA